MNFARHLEILCCFRFHRMLQKRTETLNADLLLSRWLTLPYIELVIECYCLWRTQIVLKQP